MISSGSEVKGATGLGFYLKVMADRRGPMPGSLAFDARNGSNNGVEFKLSAPADVGIDVWGDSVKAAEEAALGTGGDRLPRVSREMISDGQETETKQLLTTCSTAPRRWNLLDKVQFLCRPIDREEKGPAVCGCGYPAETADSINIHLRPVDGGQIRAGVSGVYRCKSPWNCPICAPAAARTRTDRLTRAINACYARGGHVALVVLTASHSASSTLAEVKTMVSKASDCARSGRAWAEATERYRIAGSTVGPEVTFSRDNGPHYHQHLLVFSLGSADDAKAAADILAARYMAAVRAAGGKISGKHGVHVEVAADALAAGEYAAKGSAAWEVSGSVTKTDTRSAGSLTPWDLVNLAFEGDAWARARWAEYVVVMKGARSCVLAPRIKKSLGLTDEPDDDADGEQQHHDADEVVGRLPSSTWRSLLQAHLAATFLARVEAAGAAGFDDVAAWATDREAEAAARIAEAKALRTESKARFEEADRRRRRSAAIEFEARRLIDCEGERMQGRTLDSVRLAAENVAAVLPDVDPPTVAEMLSAMARLRDRRAAA